ncbi:cupin domain-containing protein [Desulfosporosinus sp. FKA]|uniref:cupin domain-containing protein n=1 Tax=Desulfosporosinus sp. FKA TaxID=1969834 RepID=UPI000B4980C0|nr:cupin domain-containing protein [Desulfosporosinus sp. FKA]
MKKLVCADEVKAAAAKGQKIFCVEGNAIITPSARDMAKDLGIEFTEGSVPAVDHSCNVSEMQKDTSRGTEIDRDFIYQVVKAVLMNKVLQNSSLSVPVTPFLSESEPKSGLKIVRGRTVNFETFDTGNSSSNVAYREVVSQHDSQMSAGFLTIEKSSFDWELCYEEIDIILEGSLSLTINNKTYEACQGDVLFIPKGSKVTWSSTGYVKLFYVTYPANWPDLKAE